MLFKHQNETFDDDSSLDSADAMYSENNCLIPTSLITVKKVTLRRFCENLTCNFVFSFGFDLASKEKAEFGTKDRRFCYCYCPCGRKMTKWQKQFDAPKVCSSNKMYTPGALLDHIGSFEDDMFHTAVKFYLNDLYGLNHVGKSYLI